MTATRVLVVDDDGFVRSLLVEVLAGMDYDVAQAGGASEALDELTTFDPHVLLLDMDLGEGPSGLDVYDYISAHMPWVAAVFLTSHRSPVFVNQDAQQHLTEVPYLVKTDIRDATSIDAAIQAALTGDKFTVAATGSIAKITATQAHVLRMMAAGLTNQQIADARGTGLRAAEAMVQRTLESLGFVSEDPTYARAQAIRMYLSSGVDIRER